MGDNLDLLVTRRSVGKVTAQGVPRAMIATLLEAAIQAPNHHLTQPWRFIVLTGDARRAVGEAHAAAYLRAHPAAPDSVRERERGRLERAPTVIVCIVRTDAQDTVRAREDRDAVACAVQNILLAAHANGLATMWRTGTMVDEPDVHAALGLATTDDIVAFVYLGFPSGDAPDKPRSSPSDVVTWRDR